jgi:diacylglycerol O-acyltransferase
MQRLSGLDASFLYAEWATVHMHTLKIAVLDPGSRDDGIDRFSGLRRMLARKLPQLPAFRQRMVEAPLGLDHPHWLEDAEVDLDKHLYRRTIPAPHTMREADQVIAEIAAQPLPRDRPLWEVWLLEGLADGGVICVAKVHHALADGTASVAMLGGVGSTAPEGAARLARQTTLEATPTARELVSSALRSQFSRALTLPALALRTARGGTRALRLLLEHGRDLPLPFACPHTPYNKSLSPRRVFATASVALAPALRIKDALGVSLNDLVLYLISAALEHELSARGLMPQRSLLVSVPMSVSPSESEPRLAGNRLANLFTSLCTDIADPIERIRAISRVTQKSKQAQRELGLSTMLDWSEFVPPLPYRSMMRGFYATHLADVMPAPANAIVSNVPGPRAPLYIGDTRLRAMYSVGPLVEGMGLNVTVWSYAGQLTFSVLADRDALPDAHVITRAVAPALSALEERIGRSP